MGAGVLSLCLLGMIRIRMGCVYFHDEHLLAMSLLRMGYPAL
jgi:hypothetical protein